MKQILILIAVFVFAVSTLKSQEKSKVTPALVNAGKVIPKEVIRATREFRERLLLDPYRPAFHFTVPEDNGLPGDPNGAFFANGVAGKT